MINKTNIMLLSIALCLCNFMQALDRKELIKSTCIALAAPCMTSSPYENMSVSELQEERTKINCCLAPDINDACTPALICCPMLSALMCCPLPPDEAFFGAGGIGTITAIFTKYAVIDGLFKHSLTEVDTLLQQKKS